MKKYVVISQNIIDNIENKVYDTKLPTEELLVDLYQVSKSTIRKAVGLLVDMGYLYRVHGSGVYIRKRDYADMVSINLVQGLTKEFSKNVITSKVIEFKQIEAGNYESSKLKCVNGTLVYQVDRIRYVDGIPFIFEKSLYNKDIIKYLNQEIIEGSIFNYIENDLGHKLGFADKYFVAEVLNEQTASYLEVPVNSPSIVLDEKNYFDNGDIFNFSKCFYSPEAVFFNPSKN